MTEDESQAAAEDLAKRLRLLMDVAVAESGTEPTYSQIADFLHERGTNLSRSRWTYMVNGHRYVQDPAVFEGLAAYFDVDTDFLLGADGATTPEKVTAHAMRPQVRPKQQQPIADLRSLITDRGEVVDCQCGREHTVDQLGTEFEFPENMREILREGAGRPRLDVFGPSFLLRINRIAKAGQEDLRIESLHIVFHDDWLVVFEDVDGIGTAWHPAEDNSGRYFAADEAELTLTLIVEAAIDSYDSAALSLEDGTADCESSIFGEFEKDIESVYRLGSDASKVRSSLASLCRFIDRIPAPGASKNSDWSADAAAFAEDADDLLSRVSGIHARLTQLVTVYLALVAQKQNEDMKRVSGWAAILFTPSLVGAIYGMNFESIPELTWDFGYPLSILAMVIISAGLYAVFRRQRWL